MNGRVAGGSARKRGLYLCRGRRGATRFSCTVPPHTLCLSPQGDVGTTRLSWYSRGVRQKLYNLAKQHVSFGSTCLPAVISSMILTTLNAGALLPVALQASDRMQTSKFAIHDALTCAVCLPLPCTELEGQVQDAAHLLHGLHTFLAPFIHIH